jgi:flagellar transcriptional activator FlhC
MATKSVVAEVREITLAIELIELGARLQLLEAETSLSRDRRACCRSRPNGS